MSPSVVTIGNFDGVHLGHQNIFTEVVKRAKVLNVTPVAVTFRPHPQIALFPEKKTKLILSYDLKVRKIKSFGISEVIEQPFSREFSSQSPDEFFNEFLLKKTGMIELVVGYDFGFGKDRSGSLNYLKQACEKNRIPLTVVPALEWKGEPVSSSRIRKLISEGEITKVNELLGHPFSYEGIVTRGDQRGRRIGFPTANLKLENEVALKFGVYATRVNVQGKEFQAITNIGVRPTFAKEGEEPPILIETFLLDQTVDLYGLTLEVRFFHRIRNEKKFSSAKELTDQIAKDIVIARSLLQA